MTFESALLETKHRRNFYLDNNTVKTVYVEREKEYYETLIAALEKCVALEKLNRQRIEA